MSDFEKELAAAYEKAMDAELDAVIAESGKDPHVFSDRFEKSMEEMIRTGRPDKLWSDAPKNTNEKKKKLSGKGLRILLIAAAILLALTAVACAVPEIRESIAGFFVRIFSNHVEYVDPAITKDRIEEEYGLVSLDGYQIISKNNDGETNTVTYNNGNGTVIVMIQSVSQQIAFSVDNENGEAEEYKVNDIVVRLYKSEVSNQASWIQDGYFFSLSCPASVDIIQLVLLIDRV